MILDFKEIPEANSKNGLQDTFELFARDFLEYLGYKIITDPNRGPDGKVDLIVEEKYKGIATEMTFRWLVSCKHYAHTGKSVSDSNEINIQERLIQHNCDGFMGFYSTLCSSSLANLINSMYSPNGKKNAMVYDHEKIEQFLLRNQEGQKIASRFFPQSYQRYTIEHPTPAEIFEFQDSIRCECCGKSLMETQGGVCCFLRDGEDENCIDYVYFSCKGMCDRKLGNLYKKQYGFQENGWEEISDFCVPQLWISNLSSFHYDMKIHRYSEKAIDKMNMLFEKTFPWVARHLTTKEKEQYNDLLIHQILQLK